VVIKRSARVLLLLAAGLLVSACATLTKLAYSNAALAYSNLGPMIAWFVDDYVEMQGSQKDWVRDRITRVMSWHRSRELPEYRRFFERVLAESREPFTVDEIAQAYGDLRAHYHRTVEQVLPDVADFFLQLDSVQVAQMERKFADDNRKFVRESVKGTPEERRERRVKRFAMHLEGWLGRLEDGQRDLIEDYYRDLADFSEERLGERRFRQAETLALIRSKPSKDQMVAGLRRLFIETDSWRRPEYTRKLKERDRRFFDMLAKLSATLTPEQRERLQDRIRGYVRDISTITASN
jgi:uncharacterized membrane-anchored protein YhcB (DUF1043 family)